MSTTTTAVSASWQGSFDGVGQIDAPDFATRVSLPKDFNGRGEDATPEDLLLAALASCYLITLGILLAKKQIEYSSLTIRSELETRTAGMPKVLRVFLRPVIRTQASRGAVLELCVAAERICLISQAISGNIEKVLEPQVLAIEDYSRPSIESAQIRS